MLVEHRDAERELAQHEPGGAGLAVVVGAGAEAAAGLEQLLGLEVAHSLAQLLRGGEHDGVQLVERLGPGLVRAALQRLEQPQRLDRPVVRLGSRGGLARQHGPRGGDDVDGVDGVDDVGLAVRASDLPVRAADLEDLDALLGEVAGERGAVAAGALHADRHQLTVCAQPGQQWSVASRR